MEHFCWKLLFRQIALKILDVFFQGQTPFWPYLRNDWSDWCETKRKCIGLILGIICDLDLWPHSWPWPWMFQGQISKYLYLRNCWSDWCEMKRKWVDMILGRLYDIAPWPHPWPWPWSFKVTVWNCYISGMGWPIDMDYGTKRMWVIHSWPWYWLVWPWWGGRMYGIVNRVTSDVGVPSTYLVDNVPVIVSSWKFQELLPLTDIMSMQKVKVRGQRPRSQRSWPHLAVSGP